MNKTKSSADDDGGGGSPKKRMATSSPSSPSSPSSLPSQSPSPPSSPPLPPPSPPSALQKKEVTSEKEVKRILQICNQLSAGLQEVKREEVIIRQFDNVFSTHIFHLSFLNPSSTTSNTSSLSPLPPSLVIKFYDLVVHNQLQLFSVATSHLAHFAIGQAGLGPSIYQIRPDALVMSYLEGRTLTSKDDHSVALRGSIARRLAHFHALEVPIPRNLHQERVQNIFSSRFDEKLIESLEGGQLKASLEAAGLRNILENDLSESVAFVRSSILKDDGHQIVFGHCDFNHNNILLVGEEEKVMFIDFDYSMYFYRGTDFGRYFLDCTQTEQFSDNEILSDGEMRQFIEFYREESAHIYGSKYLESSAHSVEAILWEAKLMVLFAYLIDIIFLLRMASFCRTEEKRAMFLTQADKRYGGFIKTKQRFQNEYLKNAKK